MTNEEVLAMLEKAGITTATGGLLPAEVSNAFIDTVVDQSSFLGEINIQRNIGVSRHLDSLGAASRLGSKHTEGTDPVAGAIKGLSAVRRTLTPVTMQLPYNISFEWLAENIEREAAEQQVNAMFAKQFSNDVVDLLFNGDIADAGADAAFLTVCDGYKKRLGADGAAHVYARGALVTWKDVVFPALLAALPDKYKGDPGALKLYTSFQTEQEYRDSLADRATALGDQFLTEKRQATYQGIIVQPVPKVPYGTCILTSPKNLAAGLGRDISTYREVKPRAGNIEYTIYIRVDSNYAISDAVAYCV